MPTKPVRPTARRLCLLAAAVATSAQVGCTSNLSEERHAGDINAIRDLPAPAMKNLHQRPADRRNTLARTYNLNARMMRADAERVLLTDRPSRLTDAPSPY